jgi:2-amino-4-hydroxy-6-hydroxymethyldihydropteridine diphosphokinase
MAKVYIGLGSNLSDPKNQIHLAVDALKNIKHCNLTNLSSLYFSRPMGPQDQPDYMNAVAEISTELSPLHLLDELQTIENLAGRVRKDNRWGARILDLDILLFDNEVISHERLTVPHYGLELREFVLLPLVEISPELILPNGKNISALSRNIETNGLKIHGKLR